MSIKLFASTRFEHPKVESSTASRHVSTGAVNVFVLGFVVATEMVMGVSSGI
jgi:hypothetical protein